MSGIAGLIRFEESVDLSSLERMLGTLRHRGGFGQSYWLQGNAGLGVQHFASSAGPAPVAMPVLDGNVIAFDGRLDDRETLRRELQFSHEDWKSLSDSLIVLHAYERWGVDALLHLQGDFAFGLWDQRRQALICARDRIGVRPLYYHAGAQEFCFASEIKALLAHGVSRELDELRIANYLHARFEDKESTFYRQIKRLPPGEFIEIREGHLVKKRYWQLGEEISDDDAETLTGKFQQVFQDSVADRMRDAPSLGFLLSGGLDSSSVLAVAQGHLNGSNPHAYVATFPDFPDIDEMKWVERLKDRLRFEPHPVRVDQLGPVGVLEEIYEHLDEPFHFPNLYIYWALAGHARERGTKVLLDGMDGDTTVSHGMEYLAELMAKGNWLELAQQSLWLSRKFHSPAYQFAWHFGVLPVMQHYLPRVFRGSSGFLNKAFAKRISWNEYERHHTDRPSIDAVQSHRAQIESGIIPYHLEVYDQAAAAWGLDHRHPYYDARLVSLCTSIPPKFKIHLGMDRAIQRESLKGKIPEEIRLRMGKSNWSDNFERSLIGTDGDKVADFLRSPCVLDDFVHMERLRQTFDEWRQVGRIQQKDGMLVWTSVSLGIWLRNCYIA